MRRFMLVRHEDVTGVSGEGVIAYGCEFPDGTVTVHWNGSLPCTQVWPSASGIEGVKAIHGHSGRTVVRWVDGFTLGDGL